MKNFFICDFFDFSRKFFKAFFAFFVLFFLNFSAFAEDVYYRWTPYTDSAGAETWDGFWSVTYTDDGISKAKFWSYWKESETKWEKTFNNNTGGTADYPGSDSNKPAYTYFTGEHSVTATLDSSPANELEKLHIGDCYNSQAAGSSVGTEKITINLAGSDLNAKTLVLGSSSASVPSVNFALTGGGTLKVSGEMSFAAASGVSCTYNIEVGTGTVLDVSSIELNDSSATVNFTGDGTLKAGNAIFSAGKININVKNLEISGTFKNEAGATLSVSGLSSDSRTFGGTFENAGTAEFSGGSKSSFVGAVTNSGSAEFKDSAAGIFNGTVKNSGRLGFSDKATGTFAQDFTNNAGGAVSFAGTAKGTFNGAVTNATGGIFGFSGSAEGTFSETVKNSGIFGFLGTASGTFAQDFINNAGGAVSFSGTAKGTFNGAVTNATGEIFGFSDSAEGTFNGTVKNSGTLGFSDKAKGTFSGAVTNAAGGTFGFSGSAKGTFSSAFSNSGSVDLKNASSQIKFDGNFTNNQDGTVTLPDAAGASVTFGTGTGTDSFSNLGTVNSSGLCAVTFANQPVKDDGTWVYTGGTTSGKVILAGDISYNVLILKGNLEVPGDLTATKILVETNSLKIQGKITSDSIDVKTEKPIELTGKLTVGSAAFRLSENTNFNINNHELVFGTDAKKCEITSGAAKKLSFRGTAGSKINFHSASFGQGTDIIGDFYSEPDVLFNCDVHAKSLTAKKDAEIHAAEINTTGKQEYYGAVTVSSAAKTKFNASTVNFRGTTDIQNETEVSATGAVAFFGNLTVAAASPLAVSASEAAFSGKVTTSAKTGITAISGAVRFEKPVEAGDEFSVNADSTGGSVTFAGTVKFSGKTSLSSSAGQVRFLSTLETFSGAQVSVGSRSAVFEKTLTLGDGLSVNADITSGSVEFKEAVNSTSKIEVSVKTARFNSSVSAGDSVSVENAATAVFASALSAGTFISVKSGVSTFASSVTAANSITVEGTKATFSGDVTVSAGGALSVIAEKSFFRSDVNVSGKVDISGTAASVQFDSDFISSGTSVFDADVYFSAKGKNDVEIRTEKMSVGSENSEKNLYVSAVDDAAASAKKLSWRTPADVSGNFVLLNGNITLSNNLSGKLPDISAGKDIVLLNGDSSSMYNDSVSADFNWRSDAEGIFKYSGRENSNAVFPVAFPDGTQVSSEKFISSLSGLGKKVKLSAGKNFYCNGVNLEGDSVWNLKAGNNENSENFAEAYASSIKNCIFSSSGNGISFLSAAESFDNTGNNKNVCFGHPEIDFARTVYDDVIEVSFKDSVSGEPVKIENSNNEIWKNIAENSTFLTY